MNLYLSIDFDFSRSNLSDKNYCWRYKTYKRNKRGCTFLTYIQSIRRKAFMYVIDLFIVCFQILTSWRFDPLICLCICLSARKFTHICMCRNFRLPTAPCPALVRWVGCWHEEIHPAIYVFESWFAKLRFANSWLGHFPACVESQVYSRIN